MKKELKLYSIPIVPVTLVPVTVKAAMSSLLAPIVASNLFIPTTIALGGIVSYTVYKGLKQDVEIYSNMKKKKKEEKEKKPTKELVFKEDVDYRQLLD